MGRGEQLFPARLHPGRVALEVSVADVLREALRSRRKETFERALGRVIRANGGTYADYVDLVALVRERAKSAKTDLWEAARDLAAHP